MIEILKLGWHTTIQDLGRLGSQSFGVPISGAMDLNAFQWANKLLNNNSSAACLEMTSKGPELKFHEPSFIALTGAIMPAFLNSKPVKMYKPIEVKKGDILKFSSVTLGCRTYLAILGGFQSEKVLGSRSQYKGVTQEDRIVKENLLLFNRNAFTPKSAGVKTITTDYKDVNLKVYQGPEYHLLNSHSQNEFKTKQFTISPSNNRMGYRLNEKILQQLPEIWTAPTLPGTVQLTPDGTLIILMRDAQVTGGYPRILQLSDNALNLLAQKSTKDVLKFELITPQE